FFADTDFRRFKAHLVVQLCALTGGPCRDRGRSLRAVHAGRGIRAAHFDAFLEDVAGALETLRAGERERDELLGALRRLEPEIVAPEWARGRRRLLEAAAPAALGPMPGNVRATRAARAA